MKPRSLVRKSLPLMVRLAVLSTLSACAPLGVLGDADDDPVNATAVKIPKPSGAVVGIGGGLDPSDSVDWWKTTITRDHANAGVGTLTWTVDSLTGGPDVKLLVYKDAGDWDGLNETADIRSGDDGELPVAVAPGTYYCRVQFVAAHSNPYYKLDARFEAGHHIVSQPWKPSGPTTGLPAETYTFSTGGSVCEHGHRIEAYRYEWADGSHSFSQDGVSSHAWNDPGEYQVYATAVCVGGAPYDPAWSAPSETLVVTIVDHHAVPAPARPTGPVAAKVGVAEGYCTQSMTCNKGHAVQYTFSYGDGKTCFNAQDPCCGHMWQSKGPYEVVAHARCSQDTSITSPPSLPLLVSVDMPRPDPALASVTITPPRPLPDQPFTVTVVGRNDGDPAAAGSSISVSVLYSDGTDDLVIAKEDIVAGWDQDGPQLFEPGLDRIWHRSNGEMIAEDYLVEAVDHNWAKGVEHTLAFKVTPRKTGTIWLRSRVTLLDSTGAVFEDPAESDKDDTDQQGHPVRRAVAGVGGSDGYFRIRTVAVGNEGMFDLYAKTVDGTNPFGATPSPLFYAHFPSLRSLYLTPHESDHILNQAEINGVDFPHLLSVFAQRPRSSYWFAHRDYSKDGAKLFATPESRWFVLETAFASGFGQSDRQELYRQLLLEAIGLKETPVDATYDLTSVGDETVEPISVEQLNGDDTRDILTDLGTMSKWYGIGESAWDSFRGFKGLVEDKKMREAISDLLSQVGTKAPALTPILRTFSQFRAEHPKLAEQLRSYARWSTFAVDLAKDITDITQRANAEIALRTYLNTSHEAQVRLGLFREAYNYAAVSMPGLDPALAAAIEDLETDVGRQLTEFEAVCGAFFRSAGTMDLAQFIVALNTASNGELYSVAGKAILKVFSAVHKRPGNVVEQAFKVSEKATLAIAAAVDFASRLNSKLSFYRDHSILLTVYEVLRQHEACLHERLFVGPTLEAAPYELYHHARLLTLYLAQRTCERVLREYVPPDALDWAVTGANSILGVARAPYTGGVSILQPWIEAGDKVTTAIKAVANSDALRSLESDREDILRELSAQFVLRSEATVNIRALYLATAPVLITVPPEPPASKLRVVAIPDQEVAVGETMIVAVDTIGLKEGDRANIRFTGLVEGEGREIRYEGRSADVGARSVVITATSGSSGEDAFRLNVLVLDASRPAVVVMPSVEQSDPAASAPVRFTVVFSKPVTGFAEGDVRLGGTARPGRVSVVGEGTIYQLEVAGMESVGTVEISIPSDVASDASGNWNTASRYAASVHFTRPSGQPIAITQQPNDQTVTAGQTAVLTVTATGSEPLSYQWRKNQQPLSDGGRISGSTSASLTIAEANPDDAGAYDVVVSNAAGSKTSRAASLMVTAAYFRDTTAAAGVPLAGSKLTSAALGDVNGDGFLDLYQPSVNNQAERLLLNQETGVFNLVSNATGVGSAGDFLFASFGDYNRDGLPDLLLGGRTKPKLCRGDGHGGFTDVTVEAHLNYDTLSQNGAWVDYDGDGWLDIFLNGFGRASVLYHNNHDSTFSDVSAASGLAALGGPDSGNSHVFLDYDGDGDPDLVLVEGAQLVLARNHPTGTFTKDETASVDFEVLGNGDRYTALCAGDYDNDGNLDLFAGVFSPNDSGVPSVSGRLYRNQGNGHFQETSSAAGLGESRQYNIGAVFADINNDGYLDLIAVGNTPKNYLFINRGDGTFQDATDAFAARDLASAHTCVVGDIDNDGDQDLFLVRGNNQACALFENVTSGRHWLTLQLHGTRSNRDAIGARVTLRANGRTQVRDLFPVSGCYAGQSDPRLHFGLGDATAVEGIEIRWPGGDAQTLTTADIGGVDGIVPITEPAPILLINPHLTAMGFEFTIRSVAGRKCRVLYSEDAAAAMWSEAGIVTLESADQTWSEIQPIGLRARFYRVQAAEP